MSSKIIPSIFTKGGTNEATVAESAKKLQDGAVQVTINSEDGKITFKMEESDASSIVFDVRSGKLSLLDDYYTKAEVEALIAKK
jgi:hypothetical protein